jgi:hypothetical protein
MRAAAGGASSSVVDLYNVATGAWSTARLSVARVQLAAVSVGNVALFAGGIGVGEGFVYCWHLHVWFVFARAAVLRFCCPCDR